MRARTTPRRIQLKRAKGWRMPPNTVKVDRTTKWGNPVTLAYVRDWYTPRNEHQVRAVAMCLFRDWLNGKWARDESQERRAAILRDIEELRGRNLACWCPPGPCHADVLMEIANGGKP